MPVGAVGDPDRCSLQFINNLFEVCSGGKDVDDDFATDHGDDPGAQFRTFDKLEGGFVDHIQMARHPDHSARILIDNADKVAVRFRIQLTAVDYMDFFSGIEQVGIHRRDVASEPPPGQVAPCGILPFPVGRDRVRQIRHSA